MGTADFPVKWLSSSMPRAPVISGLPGTLIAALDALLVTGWGAITPQRVEVAGGIATVTCNAGDTFVEHCVIEISGAEQAALNGQARVLSSTTTSFTFATEAPDGFATGIISVKAAAAGWEKVFAGENKAVYRSASPLDAGWYWRVEEDQNMSVMGYMTMEDIDTGTGAFPEEGKRYPIRKSYNADGKAVHYDIFADPHYINTSIQFGRPGHSTPNTGAPLLGFGAPLHLRPEGDSWGVVVCGYKSGQNEPYGTPVAAASVDGNTPSPEMTVAILTEFSANDLNAGQKNSGNYQYGMGAVTSMGRIFLTRLIDKTSQYEPRSVRPGVFFVPQSGLLNIAAPRDMLRAHIGGSARTLCALPVNGTSWPNQNFAGLIFIDITGPWRPALGAAFDFGSAGNG